MGTLVPQGFSRSLPPSQSVDISPTPAKNARNLPEIIHRDIHRNFASTMKRQTSFGTDKKRSSSLTRGWIQASAQWIASPVI